MIDEVEEVNPETPTGDDLLWYNPKPPAQDIGVHPEHRTKPWTRLYVCYDCAVRWQDDPKSKVRCWCCGRFQKRKYS